MGDQPVHMEYGAASPASTRYMPVAYLPSLVTIKSVSRHSQMSREGRGKLPQLRTTAVALLPPNSFCIAIVESPRSCVSHNSGSPNLCVKYKQPNVPQTWVTHNALPLRPCCLRPHVTYQFVSPRLPVTHSPVTEICAAHYLAVSMPCVTNQRFTESGPQSSSQRQGTKYTWRRGDRDTEAGRGREAHRSRETHRDRDKERPIPTGPQLVMLNVSLETHQGPSPHLWIRPGAGEARV